MKTPTTSSWAAGRPRPRFHRRRERGFRDSHARWGPGPSPKQSVRPGASLSPATENGAAGGGLARTGQGWGSRCGIRTGGQRCGDRAVSAGGRWAGRVNRHARRLQGGRGAEPQGGGRRTPRPDPRRAPRRETTAADYRRQNAATAAVCGPQLSTLTRPCGKRQLGPASQPSRGSG